MVQHFTERRRIAQADLERDLDAVADELEANPRLIYEVETLEGDIMVLISHQHFEELSTAIGLKTPADALSAAPET